jgi:MSHA biogenesis protein MshJ
MGDIAMHTNLEVYAEKFNALELRIRILLSFVAIALFYMLFDLLWFSATAQSIKTTQSETTLNERQIEEFLDMQNALNSSVSNQRNNPKTKKISLLENEIEKVRQQLTERTVNLVPPEKMASVIKAILASSEELTLISLTKKASVQLSDPEQQNANSENNKESETIKLYRHSVEIVMQGSYSGTFEFLKNLENMERKVAFDSFDYNVDNYPKAEVKLVVSTLSLNKEWIGG